MKIEQCKRQKRDTTLQNTIMITMRISPKLSTWLKEKNLSPKLILFEACKELGYNHANTNTKPNKQP